MTLPLLATKMSLVERMLNSRSLTPVSDYPENPDALLCNLFQIGMAAIFKLVLPDASVYMNSVMSFTLSISKSLTLWKSFSPLYG